MRLVDAASGKLRATFKGSCRDVEGLTFSGDGQLLAARSFDGQVELWDLPAKKLLRATAHGKGRAPYVAFLPRGPGMLLVGRNGELRLVHRRSGRELGRLGSCGPGRWFLVRADGSVSGSNGGRDCLAWTTGTTSEPFQRHQARSRSGPFRE